jgi:hypothetical protein
MWCDHDASHTVDFWCEGSQTQHLGRGDLYIMASSLKVDISEAMKVLMRNEDRTCGLTVPADLLCDRVTTAPFGGIRKGAYSFTLSDVSAPTVVNFAPKDGATEVDPDSVISFTFNEPVNLGPSNLFLTFSTLDTDRSGAASSEVSSKAYPLQLPHVTAKSDNMLQFDMKGKSSPGWLYSVALPRGAVVDLSGNAFEGLSGGTYTFRVAAAAYGSGGGVGGSSSTSFIVGLVVGLVCGGSCIMALIGSCKRLAILRRITDRRRSGLVSRFLCPSLCIR